jgi:prepilin-type N-terminal cleavage/methylation domain-containing protein
LGVKKSRAFTLVELLAVISVIAILAAILSPVVGNAVDSAKKLKASKNLQQIAMVYANFALRGNFNELSTCKNVAEWAGIFSKYEELNIASVFIFNDDYLVETTNKPVPKTIGTMKNGQWSINPEFKIFPKSVVIISGISSRAPVTTTPLAYTRGLDNESGKWRSSYGDNGGVYGETGGFIVFLDGHVEFYSNLTSDENMLTNYYTGEKTRKISEAVNHGARALSWQGIEWEAGE